LKKKRKGKDFDVKNNEDLLKKQKTADVRKNPASAMKQRSPSVCELKKMRDSQE
jgi:hypothetical protein